MKFITESTLIPISIVIIIVSGASWMTTVNERSKNTDKQLTEFKSDVTTELRRLNDKLDKIVDVMERRPR